MRFAANAVVALIGLLHVWILVLEMFLWDKPTGRRAFGQTQEFATATKVLAANAGQQDALVDGVDVGVAAKRHDRSSSLWMISSALVTPASPMAPRPYMKARPM
jgi:uncharacterized membrane protein